mmetsp:Transcript_3766/g.11476  ORF Transcript_3766/g.11476 Transcript_3766/m.11476 type:complete len:202 (+) Transcript_3766:306-911(+)
MYRGVLHPGRDDERCLLRRALHARHRHRGAVESQQGYKHGVRRRRLRRGGAGGGGPRVLRAVRPEKVALLDRPLRRPPRARGVYHARAKRNVDGGMEPHLRPLPDPSRLRRAPPVRAPHGRPARASPPLPRAGAPRRVLLPHRVAPRMALGRDAQVRRRLLPPSRRRRGVGAHAIPPDVQSRAAKDRSRFAWRLVPSLDLS